MDNPGQFGPHLFAVETIGPETRAANTRIAEATRNAPPRWESPLEVDRKATSHAAGILPCAERLGSADSRRIPGPAGEIPIRILSKECPATVQSSGSTCIFMEASREQLIGESGASNL
jgi:hypothetical protein